MKKLLTFLLCVVFLMGAIGLTACGSNSTKQNTVSNIDTAGKPVAGLSVQSVSAPKLGATITRFSAGNEQASISKRISATVEPSTAQNKLVDYRVFWATGAEHANEDVSDYVIVEQDSDGSTDATVTCLQEFDDDTIVIQVITRDGGFTATCLVTYEGIASEMAITALSGINIVSSVARGEYYELGTNSTYDFSISLTNVFGVAGTSNLTIESSGWSGGNETYEFYSSTPAGYSHAGAFSIDSPSLFFTSSLNNGIVTIHINNLLIETYSYRVSQGMFRCIYSPYRETISSLSDYNSKANANAAKWSQRYFYVNVKDTVSNVSETLKFWITSSVESVSISPQSIQF